MKTSLSSPVSLPLECKDRALIIGVSGQDGAYLSSFLLKKGYEVYGTSRAGSNADLHNLAITRSLDYVLIEELEPTCFHDVVNLLSRVAPTEIYNLSGQSSVGKSFEAPLETLKSIASAAQVLLEAIRIVDPSIKFYNAGSGEVFGGSQGLAANEQTPFNPVSPYGTAKSHATSIVAMYRRVYGLFACTGILFNHESPLRPKSYVTQKIICGVRSIVNGELEKMALGNLQISRDWGFAPEYVEAMWLMLQQDEAQDFVIATGVSVSLQYFVDKTFSYFDLDWKNYVVSDASFTRPSEILMSAASPKKSEEVLGWKAKTTVDELIRLMIVSKDSASGDQNVR